MPSWVPINLDLIRNPYNWVVIILMVVIAGMALNLVFSPMSLPSADGNQP